MEPTSHCYFSHRLKLQFWDWVAPSLREHFNVYAVELRGHGNREWARGATYGPAESLLDLAALLDVIRESPVTRIGHSLGGLLSVPWRASARAASDSGRYVNLPQRNTSGDRSKASSSHKTLV